MRDGNALVKTLVWNGLHLFLLAAIFCPALGAQQIVLDFNDGLLPSGHGWTFQGQDDGLVPSPIAESQVASVSSGVLLLDTATPFGVGSDNAFAYWGIPLSPIDPTNYVMEIRMRAVQPNGFRNFCGGFLGALLSVSGDFRTELSLMPGQVTLGGAPGSTCATEINLAADGGNFHTYRVEVKNGDQLTAFVDGTAVATGTLIVPGGSNLVLFGDVSTSGGNVKAEVDFIRVASLSKTVAIDIKPGSDPNSINPQSKGVISVAILTDAGFDASTVDALSLHFGPGGAGEFHGRGHVEDADGDGDLDLVLHFKTERTEIQCGDTEATLTGTAGGQNIAGTDAIQTVGCSSRKP